ncbi:MAG: hypothetical protein PHR68_02335 [Candidatus Gracilibacteria bacterium]|nr:hypothetical protein [Candidatus Gracilibacteria bacterium]
MKNLEMHFHTKLSDGLKSNDEVFDFLKGKKIDFITATEHDIVNKDFQENMNLAGVKTAYGVEISSCDYMDKKSMHILNYSSIISETLDFRLEKLRNDKIEKIKLQIENLKNKGFISDYYEFISHYEKKGSNIFNLNSYDIAIYIYKNKENVSFIEKTYKYKFSEEEFYRQFLKKGGKFSHVGWIKLPDYEFDLKEITSHISSDNIFSLAHPNLTFENNISYFKEKVKKLVEFGLNAIEINSIASKEWIEEIIKLQKKYDLILTFGSDCHFREDFDGKHREIFKLNPFLTEKIVNENYEKIMKKLY